MASAVATSEATSILVLALSPLHRDPRVLRQLAFLKGQYELTAAGYSDPELAGVAFVRLPMWPEVCWRPATVAWRAKRRLQQVMAKFLSAEEAYEQRYWNCLEVHAAWPALSDIRTDLIVANDLEAVPMACRLAARFGAKVLVDAHEWKPGDYDGDPAWKRRNVAYWDAICCKYLPRVDAMLTVCDGIAELYTQNFGVPCDVITNAPFFAALQWQEPEDSRVRMIYHGGFHRQRHVENMIRLVDLLDDRFSLDLILVGNDESYRRELERLAAGNPRIAFRPPVPMQDIPEATNHYDVGLFLLDPSSTSYRLALPNKLFEYVQARLGVAIWPSPEMRKVVEQYGLGVVADEFTLPSMARKLNALTTADLRRFKQNSHAAAPELCAERNRDRFLAIVDRVLNRPAAQPCKT